MKVTGTIDQIRYTGKASWTVAVARVGQEMLTVTGFMVLHVGQPYEFDGDYVEDVKWGRQFKVAAVVPLPMSGIEAFLALLPDIGPKRGFLIRERFGDDIWNVLDTRPEELRQISGLTDERITKIREEYLQRKDDRELIVWCGDKGISPYETGLLKKHYENEVLKVLKSDTYRITEVDGIGFRRADAIAQKLGVPPESPQRCRAAIKYVLKEVEDSTGSTLVSGALVMACLRGHDRGPNGRETPTKLTPPVPDSVAYPCLASMRGSGEIFLQGDRVQVSDARTNEVELGKLIAERVTGEFRPRDAEGNATDQYSFDDAQTGAGRASDADAPPSAIDGRRAMNELLGGAAGGDRADDEAAR